LDLLFCLLANLRGGPKFGGKLSEVCVTNANLVIYKLTTLNLAVFI
jgi:hypothetical protein